ncbi:MAG TPA: cupin domain-containing protein [Polyangiales bacterium]|nr:cupin domain-containing protein [Polyangiales bacterium]
MKPRWMLCSVAVGLAAAIACEDDSKQHAVAADASRRADAADSNDAGTSRASVLDLADVKLNPMSYDWFDFRPNVKKLILAGAAETEHVAILWYTTADGGVGLHHHAKTESVYVIDGTQTDAKGSYPTGTVYFNPPGSGHQITESSGFFLLAYAAPPDFMRTDEIGEYTPVRIDTAAERLTDDYAFEAKSNGVAVYTVPLEDTGGMHAALLEVTTPNAYAFSGSYVLVLKGHCVLEGARYGEGILVVSKTVTPRTYDVAASDDAKCTALAVSF